jgi:hypothetical protein
MATFNLVRNSRVFFTSNVAAATGIVAATGFTAANSQELQVLDGFTFSQASTADTIKIDEAGITPNRGERSFNVSLGTVDFSFTTYIRPYLSTTVKAEESHLWNALFCTTALGTTPASVATTITAATLVGSLLSLTGTGFTAMTVGEIVVIKGVSGVGASQFNTAVKIVTSSTTGITANYVVTPSAAVVAGNWTSTVTFNRTAWNEQTAQVGDLIGTPGIPSAYSETTTALSNKNTLLPFGLVITVDGVTYAIDNCALDQAVVDFGLGGIAMVAWTGKGTALRQLSTNVVYATPSASTVAITGGLTGTITAKVTTANFITNKLSTVTLISNIAGVGGTSYTLALTGGSITINNNITYVTPANLGMVNQPVGYFTGSRDITGTLTAYLRTGTTNTAGLLNTLLTNSSTTAGVEPKFKLQVEIGGASNGTRVEIQTDGAFLQIPTIATGPIMSTTIAFKAQGSETSQVAGANFDIENTNDLEVRYFSI